MDYKSAGVDIEAGYESVELIKKHVKETLRPEVLGHLEVFQVDFPQRLLRIWKSLFYFQVLTG